MAKNPGVNLSIDKLEQYVEEFKELNPGIHVEEKARTISKAEFSIRKPGHEIATVILYIKSTGLTTVTYKTGKNHDLGKIFHDLLQSKCGDSETNKVNLVLKGISKDEIDLIIELMKSERIDNDEAFTIAVSSPNEICTIYSIACNHYRDATTVTYHHSAHKLQIQGRALYGYRLLSYHLSDILDQQSLMAVIERTSIDDIEEKRIIHEEVAAKYIEKSLPNAYFRLDKTYQNLLVSSYCVKLGSPNLPEYSMLLYADLRVLEGIIKETLMKNDLYTSSEGKDIGEYFSGFEPKLKDCYEDNFSSGSEIVALEKCYDFFKRNRHSLFHMGETGYESRTTDTLREVMQLSDIICQLIDDMYQCCNKL